MGTLFFNEKGIKDRESAWKQSFGERNMSCTPIFIFIQIKYKCKFRSNVYNQRRVWHHKLFKNDSCSYNSPLPLHARSSAALSNFTKFTSGWWVAPKFVWCIGLSFSVISRQTCSNTLSSKESIDLYGSITVYCSTNTFDLQFVRSSLQTCNTFSLSQEIHHRSHCFNQLS